MDRASSHIERAFLGRWRRVFGFNSAGTIHLFGMFSFVVYGWLCWKSRGVDPVPLGAFFVCLSLVWTALLVVFLSLGQSEPKGPSPDEKPRKLLLISLIFWAFVFRLAGILASPILAEDDYFRFLWDGYQFANQGSPYGAAPADFFEDETIPDVAASLLHDINYPELPTIYGPVMEVVFLFGYLIEPASLITLKCLFVIFEALALFFLSRFLSTRWLLVAAWCPLLIFETTFQAHPDIIGVAFLIAALWASKREKPWLAMLLLGLATCAKPFAILAWPFLVKKESWFRQGCLFAVTLFLIYLPFVWRSSDAGAISLGAMANHWEFNSLGYGVVKALFGDRARLLCLALFTLVYLLILVRFRERALGKTPLDVVYGAFFFLSPVINPWYLTWLLPFAMLKPRAWSITALVVISLSYATGLNLGDASLAEFEIPVWIRVLEFSLVGVALVSAWTRPDRHPH